VCAEEGSAGAARASDGHVCLRGAFEVWREHARGCGSVIGPALWIDSYSSPSNVTEPVAVSARDHAVTDPLVCLAGWVSAQRGPRGGGGVLNPPPYKYGESQTMGVCLPACLPDCVSTGLPLCFHAAASHGQMTAGLCEESGLWVFCQRSRARAADVRGARLDTICALEPSVRVFAFFFWCVLGTASNSCV
jgi:hypothetical protein